MLNSIVYYILHIMSKFGEIIKQRRLELGGRENSLRRVAEEVSLEPSYLSKIERGLAAPPGEEAIQRIAKRLGLDPDIALAAAGKISSDLHQAITERPEIFGSFLRSVMEQPDAELLKIIERMKQLEEENEKFVDQLDTDSRPKKS